MPTDEWEIIDVATTEIGVQLGSDPASEAVRDYIWHAGDLKGRKLDPITSFVGSGTADSSELERLMVGVANASRAWPEDIAAVVRIVRRAFEEARGVMTEGVFYSAALCSVMS
jgi:hypothetical protein